jgi:hypothetical protein
VQQRNLFEPFIRRLDALGLPYIITGSTAGTLYGEPRLTHDIDLVVALTIRDVHRFVEAFPLEDFYCPPEDVLAIEVRRRQRGHCNVIHHQTGFKADIYVAFDELHRWALANRRRLAIDDLTLSVAPVEYVILRKLEYFREGHSEKHVRDIRGMLDASDAEIDTAFLAEKIAQLGLVAEWQYVISGQHA